MAFLPSLISFTIVTSLLVESRSVPLKIPHSQPTELASALALADVPPTIEHNLERNVIQSAEESVNCHISETYTDDQLTRNTDKMDSQIPKVDIVSKEHRLAPRTNPKIFSGKCS